MRPLRILTWHIHGSYLYYLTHLSHTFYIPYKEGLPPGYVGARGHIPWGKNVVEVPADHVKHLDLDCIIFQWREHYFRDQYEILSSDQQRLPKIYLEHDPPQQHPTFTAHPVNDPNTLLVHVTPFNDLMWDSGRTPRKIIEHGVLDHPEHPYQGDKARGLVVVNHLKSRGRRLGADIFEQVRQQIPLDLVGMGAEDMGGLGEVQHDQLPAFSAQYRFFFNPIRYTSLGLAVCEAMMQGLPIVGLATTELSTVIENGISGYIDTRIDRLIEQMQKLIQSPNEARRLGEGARRTALNRFSLPRFINDWNNALDEVTDRPKEVLCSTVLP